MVVVKRNQLNILFHLNETPGVLNRTCPGARMPLSASSSGCVRIWSPCLESPVVLEVQPGSLETHRLNEEERTAVEI